MNLPLCDSCKRQLEWYHGQLEDYQIVTSIKKDVDPRRSILFWGKYMNGEHCQRFRCLKEFIEKLAEDERNADAQ